MVSTEAPHVRARPFPHSFVHPCGALGWKRVGLCDWIEDMDQLEALFPAYGGIKRRISRLIRIAS